VRSGAVPGSGKGLLMTGGVLMCAGCWYWLWYPAAAGCLGCHAERGLGMLTFGLAGNGYAEDDELEFSSD